LLSVPAVTEGRAFQGTRENAEDAMNMDERRLLAEQKAYAVLLKDLEKEPPVDGDVFADARTVAGEWLLRATGTIDEAQLVSLTRLILGVRSKALRDARGKR
jgi:hypothetical protein